MNRCPIKILWTRGTPACQLLLLLRCRRWQPKQAYFSLCRSWGRMRAPSSWLAVSHAYNYATGKGRMQFSPIYKYHLKSVFLIVNTLVAVLGSRWSSSWSCIPCTWPGSWWRKRSSGGWRSERRPRSGSQQSPCARSAAKSLKLRGAKMCCVGYEKDGAVCWL